MQQELPLWREYQSSAGHDDHVARFLVITRGDYDLVAGLREAVRSAYDTLNLEELDDATADGIVQIQWSCPLPADVTNGGTERLTYTLHRVLLRPASSGYDDLGRDGIDTTRGDGLVRAFAEALDALPRGDHAGTGVDHTIGLHDPQRLAHYTDLYREIAAIEMAIRECLSLVFLRAYPDRAHVFLDNTIVVSKIDSPGGQELASRQENQLFYLTLREYALVNQLPEAKVQGLVQQIGRADSFDALKELILACPIPNERDGGFVASLKDLLDPIERVRNPICHGRSVPRRAWENYENARTKLWERLAQFWEDELRNQ